VLLAGMAWYGYAPGWSVLLLPVFAFLVIAAALSAGLWLSALNVQFRDVQALVPFLTQIWMYTTPIIYPVSAVPAEYRAVMALNPMSGVVEGFRWAVLGTVPPDAGPVAVSAALVGLLLATGLLYFRRTERIFADVV
jgi:lipopolysaccharide transport system permease protein